MNRFSNVFTRDVSKNIRKAKTMKIHASFTQVFQYFMISKRAGRAAIKLFILGKNFRSSKDALRASTAILKKKKRTEQNFSNQRQ